jgi:hypothetical protein
MIQEHLTNLLPSIIQVVTGEVFDRYGETSPQCDALIADGTKSFSRVNGYARVPMSSALAYGEVKSNLDKEEPRDALAKVRAARSLSRQAKNLSMQENIRRQNELSRSPFGFPPPLPSFIVGFKGTRPETIAKSLADSEVVGANPAFYGPELVWVLGEPPLVKIDNT